MLVIDRRGEWLKIVAVEQPSKKDPLGYPGLGALGISRSGLAHRRAVCRRDDAPQPTPGRARTAHCMMSLYLDTRLPVESTQKDWVQVRLPDGETGWLRSATCA